MGEYMMCPVCGNTKKGDAIHRCNNCSQIICNSCSVKQGWSERCPKCGVNTDGWYTNWTLLGKIGAKS
jgi:hypothetical protein